jgi:hypothetical protein
MNSLLLPLKSVGKRVNGCKLDKEEYDEVARPLSRGIGERTKGDTSTFSLSFSLTLSPPQQR